MNELAKYLLQHAVIDFEGDLSIETARQFLRDEDSREARALLSKLIEDKGVDDFMVTVADCLREHISRGINERVVCDQLIVYSES